jgi:cell division ATPase FtsA
MKGCCGIDIDRDKTFISFAALKRSQPVFLKEEEAKVVYDSDKLIDFLKNNGELINATIRDAEKKLSIYADTVYLNLPLGLEKQILAEAVVPLKYRKKIDWRDISFAKKYLQDAYLEWDDLCVHHLVLNYEVEGVTYKNPPIGLVAKKIKVKSFLLSVKDAFYKDIEDIFNNLERKFIGFIFPALSFLCAAFTDFNEQSLLAVVYVGYDKSYVVAYQRGVVDFVFKSDFGLKKIYDDLSQKLILPVSLAQEIFKRYVSFKDTSHLKEVSIKSGEAYINLSTQTVNSLARNILINECNLIFTELQNRVSPQTEVSFAGRLNSKEGLGDFLRSYLPYPIKITNNYKCLSSSFGCIRYGTSKYFERNIERNNTIVQSIAQIYKDYF